MSAWGEGGVTWRCRTPAATLRRGAVPRGPFSVGIRWIRSIIWSFYRNGRWRWTPSGCKPIWPRSGPSQSWPNRPRRWPQTCPHDPLLAPVCSNRLASSPLPPLLHLVSLSSLPPPISRAPPPPPLRMWSWEAPFERTLPDSSVCFRYPSEILSGFLGNQFLLALTVLDFTWTFTWKLFATFKEIILWNFNLHSRGLPNPISLASPGIPLNFVCNYQRFIALEFLWSKWKLTHDTQTWWLVQTSNKQVKSFSSIKYVVKQSAWSISLLFYCYHLVDQITKCVNLG